MTLFDLDPEHATEGYRRLLNKGREEDRARLDRMYARAAAFLDANFKDQFARATNDRFFELHLANALMDHDFVLEPPRITGLISQRVYPMAGGSGWRP